MSVPEYAFPSDKNRNNGLSKREYFAAHALAGMLAAGKSGESGITISAIRYADALIQALASTDPPIIDLGFSVG